MSVACSNWILHPCIGVPTFVAEANDFIVEKIFLFRNIMQYFLRLLCGYAIIFIIFYIELLDSVASQLDHPQIVNNIITSKRTTFNRRSLNGTVILIVFELQEIRRALNSSSFGLCASATFCWSFFLFGTTAKKRNKKLIWVLNSIPNQLSSQMTSNHNFQQLASFSAFYRMVEFEWVRPALWIDLAVFQLLDSFDCS